MVFVVTSEKYFVWHMIRFSKGIASSKVMLGLRNPRFFSCFLPFEVKQARTGRTISCGLKLDLKQVTSYRTKGEETPGIPCVDGVLMNVKAINSIQHGGISSESFTECQAADEGEEASD